MRKFLICTLLVLSGALAGKGIAKFESSCEASSNKPKQTAAIPTPVNVDKEILNPENWHKARFNNTEYVLYTGPGQITFHHYLPLPEPVKTEKPKTENKEIKGKNPG